MRFPCSRGRIRVIRTLPVVMFLGPALLLDPSPGGAGEIHRAIVPGDTAAVDRLLGAEPALASLPSEDDPFRSLPLHLAAMHGRVDIARRLLEAGADIDAGDVDGSTALDDAALNRQPEMVSLLLSHGADVNRRDRNGACALSFAASAGDSAIVDRLLDAGADLHFRSRDGMELVHYAAMRGLDGLFDRLVREGHDVTARTGSGRTALHFASSGGQLAMVQRLLDADLAPTVADTTGETPLGAAAWRGRTEVAALLLARGAPANGGGGGGITPLHVAAATGGVDLAKLLLEHGADPNLPDAWDDTVLMTAVASGNAELVGALLGAGAVSDVKDAAFGATPLHVAAARGYADVVGTLLDGGADPSATDAAGRTPLELAMRYGQRSASARLAERAGTAPPEVALASQRIGRKGDASVRWMGHSGWAVETKDHLLVFDYRDAPRPPDEPALRNGHIDAAQLTAKPIVVFVSHAHGDHFSAPIFTWRERNPKVTYVLGFDPPEEPGVPWERIGPRESRRIAGVDVTTIESNDSGVGFVVVADGVTVFHAGDHANRNRDLSGSYPAEIEWLAGRGVRPDVAFLPVSGCGFGDQEAVRLGAYWTLQTLKPKVFCPMHGGEDGRRYVGFVQDAQDGFPDVRMFAAERRGDMFGWRGGRLVGETVRL